MSVPLAELGAVVECLAAMGAEEELAELLERELRHPDKGRLEEEFAEWCRAPREGEPPYEFVMGSPEDEEGRDDDEVQVRVLLSQPLWVRPIAVTYGQWLLMAEKRDHVERWGDAARLPVTHVSWFDANLYARWLEHWRRRHRLLGLGGAPEEYRISLPSEAQREFFARAGTTTRFWSGEDDRHLGRIRFYGGNTGDRIFRAADSKANQWGLCDVLGNVWEWCSDWYHDPPCGGLNPSGPLRGLLSRSLRGGSYRNERLGCRSADRNELAPDASWVNGGFRLVLSAPERSSKLGHWE